MKYSKQFMSLSSVDLFFLGFKKTICRRLCAAERFFPQTFQGITKKGTCDRLRAVGVFMLKVTEDFEVCYARAMRDYERDLRLRRIQIGLRLLFVYFVTLLDPNGGGQIYPHRLQLKKNVFFKQVFFGNLVYLNWVMIFRRTKS